MNITNSGRALPLPPKGINVNSSTVTDLAERSQTSTCLEHSGHNCAPGKNLADAESDWQKSPTIPTGREARHG
jgi:hypothetical protein